MKDTNNIGTYLNKHDSLVAVTTLLSFRGAIAANDKNYSIEECIKRNTPSNSKNKTVIKK